MHATTPKPDAQRVLITDGETRAVVAACRGLDEAGFAVTAVAGQRPAAAHWSRSCRTRRVMAHPLDDPERFATQVAQEVAGSRYAVLVPGSDASLVSLSRHRAALEPHVSVALPSQEQVDRSLDKRVLAEAASAAGIPAPESEVCSGAEAALATAERLGFPLVLKAPRVVFEQGGARREGSVRVDDAAQLERVLPVYGDPCLLQRPAAGPIVSFGGVLAGGRLLGTAVSRYLRTWLPQAGNVSFSETIEPPAGLAERVTRLLGAVGWEGIFEVELIERPDGSYATIDLNPRVYGSLALAIAAGANLPALWCQWVLKRDPRPVVARPGVRYRWEDGDLRHFLWQARRGRLGEAARVLRPRRGTVHPQFRKDDPAPLAARAVSMARSARRRPQEVAIVGAGPYGLAAAAHLRGAGVRIRMFGEPLEFWRTQMPKGMLLRSRIRSTHISDPKGAYTIHAFEAAEGRTVRSPSLRLEEFVDYGRWFQHQVVPDVDRRKVRAMEPREGRFTLTLEDGEELAFDRTVVAAGLFPFARRPAPFAGLPSSLVSHSSEHDDLGKFAGANVLVVGGGQSALESAALLGEAGASVEVLARIPAIWWLPDGPGDEPARRTLRSRLPLPRTDVGGFVTGWTAAVPDLWRRVPGSLKPTVSFRCIRPAGSGWLRPRLERVPINCERTAVEAARHNGGVRVTLDDGSSRTADHVLLGTGYQIDVRRYPFLSEGLAQAIEVVDGYPRLGPGLESTVPGLHFMGAPAAMSFGPIMRFVVGTWYAAPALTARVRGRPQRPLRWSFY